MWFTRFGEFINRGLKEASLVALIFSLIPFFGWVSSVITALVTMRSGAQRGGVVLIVTLVPSLILLWFGTNAPWVISMILGSVLCWILAITLRETGSWGQVFLASVVFTIVIALFLHLTIGDTQAYWLALLQKIYAQADKEAAQFLQVPANMSLGSYLKAVSAVITPMIILMQVLLALVNLLIARWWQASLFNPGGLGKELLETRLSFWATVILAVTVAAIYLGIRAGWDVLPTVIMVFFLAGLVAFHNYVKLRGNKILLLWLLYVFVVLLFPYSVAVVAGLGIANTFVSFSAKEAP